jgi:RHS repeat-associated protein
VDIPSTAFAPESANNGTRTYQYGINGSLRSKQDSARTEYYLFNGFGNLKVYSDDGASYGYYSYDAGGERTYKMQLTEVMAQTNTYGGKFLEVEKLTLYPNGYINIDQYGNYTKHYYAESQRVASKIGGGSSRSLTDTVPRLQNYLQGGTIGGNVSNGEPTTIPFYLTLPSHLRKYLEDVILPHDTIAQIIFDTVRITHLVGSDSTGLENELFFYHGDHLSSTQLVTDINGSAQQHVLYSAFGEVVYEYNAYWKQDTIPRFLYNAKEMDEESGMYYYSARYYAPPTFISRDPAFEEYPTFSPYCYVANNPMKYVDTDGEKIRFAPGVSAEFKKDFKAAINHLNKNGMGGIASALEKSNRTYYIAETKGTDIHFNLRTMTINWNPAIGLETDENIVMSPTTVLNHEFAHALIFDMALNKNKIKEYFADKIYGSDTEYDSKNEKWVITRIEQKTAKALGEIKEGEVTRKNHKGRFVHTESPTSNVKIDGLSLPEFILTAPKIDD